MASDDKPENAYSGNCKYCKSGVANSIAKCVICEGIFHTSCALRVAGLMAVGKNNQVKCCLKQSEVSAGANSLKELVQAKDEIIKSKDEIISELRDKEALLYTNIKLLEEKIKNKYMEMEKSGNTVPSWANVISQHCQQPQNTNDANPISAGKHMDATNTTNTTNMRKNEIQHTNKNKSDGRKMPNSNETNPINSKQVNAGIIQAETLNKMNEIIHLGQPIQEKERYGWQQIKRRKFVVGENKSAGGISTVPKYTHLHVTRLSPDTKREDLLKFLKPNFQEVECEEHPSKYPNYYASMKVTIRQEDFKHAWKREVWPTGAVVSKFLRKKRVLSTITDPQVEG